MRCPSADPHLSRAQGQVSHEQKAMILLLLQFGKRALFLCDTFSQAVPGNSGNPLTGHKGQVWTADSLLKPVQALPLTSPADSAAKESSVSE